MSITLPIYAQGPNYANLRHPKSFPKFTTLPGDPPPGVEKDECDITYYDLQEVADDPDADPIRHWCLIAEILVFMRSAEITVIMVRDKAGRIVPVKVETEEYEQTFPVEQVVPGHTIALLYSVRETYKSVLVVPVDDTEWVKIFPVSLGSLMRVNDSIQDWPAQFAIHTMCYICENDGDPSRRCPKCGIIVYCSKECQERGQTSPIHHLECQIVGDRDFQFMMTANWRVFEEDYYFFPTKREASIKEGLGYLFS